MNIDDIVKAVIDDEPDLASQSEKLARSLKDAQDLNFSIAYQRPNSDASNLSNSQDLHNR
ncbi:Uncharacterised protein [Moraxella caviae]|nr:hypothetical protein [Moraxella caviae]STZ13534.1 Uncharacterised protein [Moraxella caviae]